MEYVKKIAYVSYKYEITRNKELNLIFVIATKLNNSHFGLAFGLSI